jgi:hypothetical protein
VGDAYPFVFDNFEGLLMIQSINLDDDLIAQATQLSDAGDLNGVIEMALREYIDRRQRLKIVDLFGTIDYMEKCFMVLADVLEAARQLPESDRRMLANMLLEELPQPSLAELFAEAREVLARENYTLEVPPRIDRESQFLFDE